VGVDVDVIVDADPAQGTTHCIRRARPAGPLSGAINLLNQLAASDAEPAQALPFVEARMGELLFGRRFQQGA
jgi:hypothetical protein